MELFAQNPGPILDQATVTNLSVGIGIALIVTLIVLGCSLFTDKIHMGWWGLLLLLALIIFAVVFSFVIIASTPDMDSKIAIALIDGVLALGSALLSRRVLTWLGGDNDQGESDEG